MSKCDQGKMHELLSIDIIVIFSEQLCNPDTNPEMSGPHKFKQLTCFSPEH